LSAYDQLRLELHEDEEVAQGKARWAQAEEWSEWASPSFVVDQSGKGLLGRPIRDYRWVNSQTMDYAWPSPSAEACLARAQKASLLSTPDCIWGFIQLPVAADTSRLLALATRRGILFPQVLYLGPKQGPGLFQGLMDSTFGRLRGPDDETFHSIFMDDVCIATEGYEGDSDDDIVARHALHCELFLGAALKRRIQFKLTKCRWCLREVSLLGFRVGQGARRLDPAKIQGLRDWPDPQSPDDLVSFRAYANFIKEYIPGYYDFDHLLRPYAKKGARIEDFRKDPEAVQAFKGLKAALAADALLHSPDWSKAADGSCPFELYVDASDYAWGCTLAQRPSPDKAPRPVAVYSRSFTATETAWSAFERELFAIR
jgi:hypothetical protein